MLHFILKKIFTFSLSIFIVITGTFFLMKLIPGDPFLDDKITKEVLLSLRSFYGLNEPLWKQYFLYLKSFFHLDFGLSLVYHGRPVSQFIAQGFPVSAQLGLQALFISIPAGILLGSIAAFKRGQWQDHCAMVVSTLGVSVPNFVFASLLQYFIALKLHLFPVARWGHFDHTVLPTLALAALPMAFIARLTRSNLVEVLQQDYLRTAFAKGLGGLQVALHHGLRNALLPVIAYLGPVSAQILTGSFIIERIFAIPGLGDTLIHSIHNRDYPVIIGITVFYSVILLISIFLSDLLSALIDPRIQSEQKKRTYA